MGQNWAITIGINEYDNLRALKYAERDAESMGKFFRDSNFEQVYFFAKNAPPIPANNGATIPADPTTSRLRNFLRRRFEARPLEAGDTLWFFFAGHGKRRGERDYLMPLDADPGDVERTGLAVRDLAETLRGSGAGNVIVLVDACRDDGSRNGVGIGLEKQQGLVTLFSCAPEQQSYEIEELRAGAFTYALLQGLRIQGEGNCATVARLAEHVRVQVPYLVKEYRKTQQNPYLAVEPDSKRNLILLPTQATPADVKELKYAASEAENEGDWDLAEAYWSRVVLASPSSYQEVFRAIKRLEIKKDREGQANVGFRSEPARPELARSATPKPKLVQVDDYGEDLGQGIRLEMVRIPAGEFTMGSPAGEESRDDNEGPQHRVQVPEFFLGKFAVTQAQWKQVAALPKQQRELKPDPAHFKGASRPVECVSWEDAQEFCARLSQKSGKAYRLPSEAEWEYACRAGTETPFYFGETITPDLVNYDGNYTYGKGIKGEYRKQTTEVGIFPANAFDLYDMHGNVWEWCEDDWHESYEGAPQDGSAWKSDESYRLLRGGSWLNYPRSCRSAICNRGPRDLSLNFLGFRVACRVSPRTS